MFLLQRGTGERGKSSSNLSVSISWAVAPGLPAASLGSLGRGRGRREGREHQGWQSWAEGLSAHTSFQPGSSSTGDRAWGKPPKPARNPLAVNDTLQLLLHVIICFSISILYIATL